MRVRKSCISGDKAPDMPEAIKNELCGEVEENGKFKNVN